MNCPNCKLELDSTGSCILCGLQNTQYINGKNIPEIKEIYIQQNLQHTEEPETCYHTCPKCSEVYSHNLSDHQCKIKFKVGRSAICPHCIYMAEQYPPEQPKIETIQQDIVIAERLDFLKRIENPLIENRELAEIMNEHESFVVLEFGSDHTKIEQHIIKLKQVQLKFRAKEMGARRILGALKTKEMLKLTPEEREAYKKERAHPPKPPKKVKESDAGGSKELTMIKKLL